jgi:hypothetical protein
LTVIKNRHISSRNHVFCLLFFIPTFAVSAHNFAIIGEELVLLVEDGARRL